MNSYLLVNSGIDAGLAIAVVWCLAACGGWYAGTAAYFLNASDRWVWKRLNLLRRFTLCLLGTAIALLGLLLLPATLPSAHSAWWWHKSRRLHREKQMALMRGLSQMLARRATHARTTAGGNT